MQGKHIASVYLHPTKGWKQVDYTDEMDPMFFNKCLFRCVQA
jgi:hypothetical protein